MAENRRSRVYTLDELDDLEEINEENVTNKHLQYAMNHILEVLERSDTATPYAVMGGMSMIMRGFTDRSTTDVDIAVQANARTILEILESDRRVLRPRIQMVAGSGVARIFVATGRTYGENANDMYVEVDLILSGNRGAPQELAGSSVEEMDWAGPSGRRRYNILSLRTIFTAKLSAYYHRDSENDLKDLRWMCETRASQVRTFSHHSDRAQREYFFEAMEESENFSEEELGEIRQTLNL